MRWMLSCVQLQLDIYFLVSPFCPPCILMKGFPFTTTIIISQSQHNMPWLAVNHSTVFHTALIWLFARTTAPVLGNLCFLKLLCLIVYFPWCLNMSTSNIKDVWEGPKAEFKKWAYYAHQNINMGVDSFSGEKYNVKSLHDSANMTEPSTSISSQAKVSTAEERKAEAERKKKERELNKVEKPNKYCTLLSLNGTRGNNLKATGLAECIKETFGRVLCEVSKLKIPQMSVKNQHFSRIGIQICWNSSISSQKVSFLPAKMILFWHFLYRNIPKWYGFDPKNKKWKLLWQNATVLADFYWPLFFLF